MRKFFVVHLIEAKRNVIVPKIWVDIDEYQMEKFIDRSLNRNQQFRIYYNPNGNFNIIPNFDDFSIQNSMFPNEGCYIGQLYKYKCK